MSISFIVKLSAKQKAALVKLAKAKKRNMSEVMRELIEKETQCLKSRK